MQLALALATILGSATGQTPARITPEQARDGWILLFDGESSYGWKTSGEVKFAKGRIAFPPGGKGEMIWPFALPPAFELSFESRGKVSLNLVARDHIAENDFESPRGEWKRHVFTHDNKNGGLSHFAIRAVGPAEIRDIRLKPTVPKSLFNGKDLAGWSIFDGKKSKFAVKDGLLTIEDGPGDLQTDGKYQNFLLQLECRTNGKGLNSGVFFRCRPGEYQNGYEAQINNSALPTVSKEYVVEEFDPKTNKSVAKTKVLSAAADYGTGAIYRRIPARKLVAQDGEWFTLTVIASGNHLATWVDGIQTVDWYDNRAPSDNARTGFRRDGGHISLQGHDPTTNLSFRNIRIAELAK